MSKTEHWSDRYYRYVSEEYLRLTKKQRAAGTGDCKSELRKAHRIAAFRLNRSGR